MKAMLSQPMAGKTDEEIIATREKAIKVLDTAGTVADIPDGVMGSGRTLAVCFTSLSW